MDNNACYGNALTATGSNAAEISILSSVSDLTTNCLIKNNIGYATVAGAYAIYVDAYSYDNAGLDITNNCWYRASGNWYFWNDSGGDTLATWNAFTGVGTDLNSDPLFANPATPDFTPQAISPCINAGVDVSLTEDYAGNPIIGLPDIGAYEYQGGWIPKVIMVM